MIIDNCQTWSVRVCFPPGSTDSKGARRRYAHNDTITVVAASLDRASELVKKQWPGVTIWGIGHVGSRTVLMVDELEIAGAKS